MKKLLFLATLALATVSFAVTTSEVVFTLVPAQGATWTYTIGIDDTATDAYDSGLDANEPPVAPGPEVRMHTLGVPGAASGLLMDYRDGVGPIDGSAAGLAADLDEAWGLGAVDYGYPDLVTNDGFNLGLTGLTHCVLSWDLSGPGLYDYTLAVIETSEVIALTVGGTYEFDVPNRSGLGPTMVIGAKIIPEPGTMMLVGTGLLALVGLARRR
jgi:hypothetical protein